MAKAVDSTETPSFETALAELEAIVARMEDGQMDLEESLRSYRRGAELVRFCQSRLADAEQQVRVLEGDLLKPYSSDPGES
jgi:exodeoxyribonuclease VII small subunit